jgi:hypothetical protein
MNDDLIFSLANDELTIIEIKKLKDLVPHSLPEELS